MTRTTLTFLGAAGTVTGSKYLVTVDRGSSISDADSPVKDSDSRQRRILIDAGMFQGEKQLRELNWSQFPVPANSISDVLLTHAHMDHSGYLPALVKQGFTGNIWCTEATRQLAEIVLRDAGFLQERDAEHAADRGYSKHNPPLALYGVADVEQTLPLFKTVEFDAPLDLGDDLTALFVRAGHILGSASIRLATPNGSILFSGDLGRPEHPVLSSRETPPGADYVLVESTYGDRSHPDPVNLPHEELADAIRRTVQRGGSVLIPAFAVDRTEIVLKTISEMMHQGRIPEIPVFVNSPMALNALKVYRDPKFADELNPDLDPKSFIDLPHLREVKTTEESMKLNKPTMPCVIISSSGMATGGRVLHHLEYMLPDHRNTIILTGYQAVGTRGRSLIEGAKQLKMHGNYVPVRAEIIQDDEFSVHADGDELVGWVDALQPPPRTVFCIHGEARSSAALAARITKDLGLDAVVPTQGETVRITGVKSDAVPTAATADAEVPASHPATATSQDLGVAVTVAGQPVSGAQVHTDLSWDPSAGDAHTIVLRGTITIHLD